MLSPVDILRYARVTLATYELTGPVDALLSALGWRTLDVIRVDGWLGAVATDGAVTVMAFRGTDDLENIKSDLEVCPVPFENTTLDERPLVHAGGLAYWRSVESWARTHTPLDGNLVLTGHSAGAWPATYGAANLLPALVVTFGSPKVGLEDFPAFYAHLRIPTTRVVHHVDLVPHLPPGDHWRHCCDELAIADDGTPMPPNPPPLLERLREDLAGMPISDHHMPRYVQACQAYVDRAALSKGA